MKRTMRLWAWFSAACAVLALASCMTLQKDVVASSAQQVEDAAVLSIEADFARLDARYAIEGVPAAHADECARLLARLQAALSDAGMQKPQQARLFALCGLVQLLDGRRLAARESYASSLAASPGDALSLILASRLGESVSLEASAALVSGAGEKALLLLERALQGYAQANYKQSVALFDSAFIALEGFYRDAYKPVRDRAWELRSLSDTVSADGDLAALLQKREITASEAAYIMQANTQLLYPYTAGKTYTEAELYRRLSGAGLFSAAGAGQGEPPPAKAVATRKLCARVLWNVYVAKKGAVATMYSSAYRGQSLPSPVADVAVSDADFDAVLGCVENELLSLVDGVHFEPDAAVSAVTFNDWLSKLK